MAGTATLTAAQTAHVRVMRAVVAALRDTPMVLKGGTALLLCYGLDRFSEDLDFDAPKKLNLESRLERALSAQVQSFQIDRTKDTETVLRYRIVYLVPEAEGRLKVEISFRDAIDPAHVVERSGIRTYAPANLIRQKTNALLNRTTARDLYDLYFLVTRFRGEFSAEVIGELQAAFGDVNQMEARFRPAFEEDDLFATQADMVGELILGIQSALNPPPSSPSADEDNGAPSS